MPTNKEWGDWRLDIRSWMYKHGSEYTATTEDSHRLIDDAFRAIGNPYNADPDEWRLTTDELLVMGLDWIRQQTPLDPVWENMKKFT